MFYILVNQQVEEKEMLSYIIPNPRVRDLVT